MFSTEILVEFLIDASSIWQPQNSSKINLIYFFYINNIFYTFLELLDPSVHLQHVSQICQKYLGTREKLKLEFTNIIANRPFHL